MILWLGDVILIGIFFGVGVFRKLLEYLKVFFVKYFVIDNFLFLLIMK